MTIATALLLFAAGFAGPEAAGERPQARDCSDDRGVNRCAADQQRRVRALFGVRPIEEHRDAGDQVRRAFYVDGYGRDVVAIEFIRAKGADPMLRVHFPTWPGEARVAPLTAPVDEQNWTALLRRSEHFDRSLMPVEEASKPNRRKRKGKEEVDEQEVITLCLHSWVFTAEASDGADGAGRATAVRSRTEDACDDGLTGAFAAEVEALAVSLLPPCAMLDPRQHRNDASRLSACRLLRGDRMAAARVFNTWDPFRWIDDAEDLGQLRSLFHNRAEIVWTGEANGSEKAAEFWLRKRKEAKAQAFFIDAVVGETLRRVRLTGTLQRFVEDAKDGHWEASPVEMIWIEEGDGYEVERATVGAFEALPKG
jgi:hypothetical protein